MDFGNRASSNLSSNIVPGSGSTDFVEDLVRLQAEAAGDDLFLDLGGAAEDGRSSEQRLLDCAGDRVAGARHLGRKVWIGPQ